MVRTQIQLEEEQVRILKKLAAAQHASMAEIIRQAVDMFAGEKMPQADPLRRRRALRAAGHFRSGIGDMATAHDEHLAEIFGR